VSSKMLKHGKLVIQMLRLSHLLAEPSEERLAIHWVTRVNVQRRCRA